MAFLHRQRTQIQAVPEEGEGTQGTLLECLTKSYLRVHVYLFPGGKAHSCQRGRPKGPAVTPEESWWEVLTASCTERSLSRGPLPAAPFTSFCS